MSVTLKPYRYTNMRIHASIASCLKTAGVSRYLVGPIVDSELRWMPAALL